VLGKHLDENRSRGPELVQLRERLQRLPRKRHHLLPHDGRFVRVQAHDEVAVAERLEGPDGVEHREQIEGHDVEWIGFECCIQCATCAGFITRAQQVHAQARRRPRTGRVYLKRPARQRDGLVKTIVARGVVPGDEIDVTIDGIERERGGGASLNVVRTGLKKRDGHIEGSRFEAIGVDGQRLLH
jgi:hypothetical protein